jgi:hypothetical protein
LRRELEKPTMREIIEELEGQQEVIKLNRIKFEPPITAKWKNPKELSEKLNPQFKKINSKLEKIDYITYLHSLEKKDLHEMSVRIRELQILKNERKYRAFDI